MASNHYREVRTVEELQKMLATQERIERCVFQDMDFSTLTEECGTARYFDCLFMGCTFSKPMRIQIDKSCLIFSHIGVPYNCFRNALYSPEELYDHYTAGVPESYRECYDYRVYGHYLAMGQTATDIKETLARTLHDHAMSDALHDFLAQWNERRVVGIMGGHGLLRNDSAYRKVVTLSKRLTEEGFLMVSGGGPGAMEATHLGAWMAGRTMVEVDAAMEILAEAPSYQDALWLDAAMRVRTLYPVGEYMSLGGAHMALWS